MQTDPAKLPLPRVPAATVGATIAAWVGAVLLVGWAAFWVESFRRFELVAKADMAFNPWTFLGLDLFYNYGCVRVWLSGADPYVDGIDAGGTPFGYPPIVLAMYAWCALLKYPVAFAIWAGCIAAIVAWGTRVVQQARVANGLPFVPLILATALMLWSMPVVFSMERGNGDAIVLLCMIGMVLAWRRKPSLMADAVVGGCIALAAWLKVYPLVLFGVLVVTGRWRALLCGLAIFAAIGLIPYRYTLLFLETSRGGQPVRTDTVGAAVDWLSGRPVRAIRPGHPPIEFSSHSLTSYWPKMWVDAGLPAISRVPGLIGAAVCLVPLGAWVTWRFWRSRWRERWVLAFMLWLVALATFWMPVSYDYNLLFLPLAIWAVWDHRDGWVSNVALLAAAIFWWQPLWLDFRPFTPALVFFLKFASLVVTAQVLVRRLGEIRADDDAAPAGESAGRVQAADRAHEDGKVLTDVS